MKYYIGEYWIMANSLDSQIRKEGKSKWLESAKKYGPYFETIKYKLPKMFLKEFEKNSWFHDFGFDNIKITNTGKCLSIVDFEISHDDADYKITFSGVKRFNINVPTTENWLMGKLTWGYSELELNDDGTWIIRILCDFNCEIEVLYKRVNIAKNQ